MMLRASVLLASALFPLSALAAPASPGDLIESIASSPRAVQTEIHGSIRGTYASVWSRSTVGPSAAQTRATIDIARDGRTLRLKGEARTVGEQGYLRLLSQQGSLQGMSSLPIPVPSEWMELMGARAQASLLAFDLPLDLQSIDPVLADRMFTLQTSQEGTQTVWTLSLAPGIGDEFARGLLQLLGEPAPASDDFFPWRGMEQAVRFSLTVRTSAEGRFLASDLSLALDTASVRFSASSHETPSAPPAVVAPAKSVPLLSAFPDFHDFAPAPIGVAPPPSRVTSTTVVDPCMDPSLSASELLSLQRTGVCTVEKVPTRFGGW